MWVNTEMFPCTAILKIDNLRGCKQREGDATRGCIGRSKKSWVELEVFIID